MKTFAKVENNVVIEVIEAEENPGDGYIECGAGIRNIIPSPSHLYDPDLDIFYLPIIEE